MAKSKINYDIEPTSFKVIKGVGVALVLAVVAWLVLSRDTSRPARQADLIGNWTQKHGSSTGYLEIKDDGTYVTHIEGEYASHLQFTDFAKKGLWSFKDNVFVAGDEKGITIKSFNVACINEGKKLKFNQVDYNYSTEFERKN